MSTLGDKLQSAAEPQRESNVVKWLKSLSDADRKIVWDALRDDKTYKTFTLLGIFRGEGAKFDKGTFVPFRRAVVAGEIKEEDIHGS